MRNRDRIRLKAVSLLAILLAAAGCDVTNRGVPAAPPEPPPAGVGSEIVITHGITAYAGPGGIEILGQQISVVVDDRTDEGEPAIMTDPATGIPFTGPDFIPLTRTPFYYVDTLLPGVVLSTITATAIGMPLGSILTCETEAPDGSLANFQDTTQTDPNGAEVRVLCIYARV